MNKLIAFSALLVAFSSIAAEPSKEHPFVPMFSKVCLGSVSSFKDPNGIGGQFVTRISEVAVCDCVMQRLTQDPNLLPLINASETDLPKAVEEHRDYVGAKLISGIFSCASNAIEAEVASGKGANNSFKPNPLRGSA